MLLLLLGLLGVHGGKHDAWPDRAYTLTNAVANAVVVVQLDPWGNLVYEGSVLTNGAGAGVSLGNQGALASTGNWLFAVNAGSGTITSLWLDPEGDALPVVVSSVSSGGVSPRSLTVWGNWLFVLNSDSVVGFKIWANGTLTMVPNSTQPCVSTGNVEILFSNSGRWLVVAQRGTNHTGFTVLPVDPWGVVWPGTWYGWTGNVPFGFDIDQWDRLFVAEVPVNSLSSWQLHPNGTLAFLDRKPTMQVGTCWATVTPNGMWAYTANAGSATVTGFWVDRWGHLTGFGDNGTSAQEDAGIYTSDLDVSADGKYLYSLGRGAVYVYWIGRDGHLTRVSSWLNSTVLPNSVTGMLVPKVPKIVKAPAAKKNAIIGGIAGGVGGAAAILLVTRRRKQQKRLSVAQKPIQATQVVQVHV